jgi:hypothetical protein
VDWDIFSCNWGLLSFSRHRVTIWFVENTIICTIALGIVNLTEARQSYYNQLSVGSTKWNNRLVRCLVNITAPNEWCPIPACLFKYISTDGENYTWISGSIKFWSIRVEMKKEVGITVLKIHTQIREGGP